MKISEVISKLTELQKELGDVPVVIFCERVSSCFAALETIERVNTGKSDNPRMAVYVDV